MTKAVCIKKSDLFPNGVTEGNLDVIIKGIRKINDLKWTLEERVTCETDETLLQLIPYITLVDRATKRLFIYQRGKGSAETRLTGKCSIGLGGHMEIEPTPEALEESMAVLLSKEGARELAEEIGIEFTDTLYLELLSKLSAAQCALMYNTRTPVDRVHLAIAFFVEVDMEEIMSRPHEAGVIERGQWLTREEIIGQSEEDTIELEQWTRLVLENMTYSW